MGCSYAPRSGLVQQSCLVCNTCHFVLLPLRVANLIQNSQCLTRDSCVQCFIFVLCIIIDRRYNFFFYACWCNLGSIYNLQSFFRTRFYVQFFICNYALCSGSYASHSDTYTLHVAEPRSGLVQQSCSQRSCLVCNTC